MAQMKKLIDHILQEKAQGNSFQELNISMKLMLKGIPVKKIDETTPDDPKILEMIYSAAKDFNIDFNEVKA